MELKKLVVQIADYLLIVIFFIGQISLLIALAHSFFDFEVNYQLENAMALFIMLLMLNFAFLSFMKIVLLVDHKRQ